MPIPKRQTMRQWAGRGLWPYCLACSCWSDETHIEGKRHVISLDEDSQTHRKDNDGQWRAYCRVCMCWSDMEHVDSEGHREAVSNWKPEEPTTEGLSWSMINHVRRKIEAAERNNPGGNAVKNLTRKIFMSHHVQDYWTWDIIEYLKEFAPPRFLDKHQLTGRIKMVQGRTNRAKLVRCVGLLHEDWRVALNHSGHLHHLEKEEVEEDEEEQDEEELDAQEFTLRLKNQKEKIFDLLELELEALQRLDDFLQEEEALAEQPWQSSASSGSHASLSVVSRGV